MTDQAKPDSILVPLPANISCFSFESILKKYHRKSYFKKTNIIVFDFRNVTFCGLLQLSQLSLWMRGLLSKEKVVQVQLPNNQSFYNFIYGYEFINFLREQNILGKEEKTKAPYTPIKSPMFPLKFHDNSEFQSFLKELNNPDRLELLLGEIKENDLVRNNVIHAIILKEIGDNIFVHSGSNASNVIMSKLSRLNSKDFEFPFSRILSDSVNICLVVSDYGLGIFNTLRQAYLDDEILPPEQKHTEPSEVDIVKYAFLKHTTSRKDVERKEALRQHISSNSLIHPLPTGLYAVKNIVKRYHGIVYVRSGRSIVCFDYFSKPGGEIIYTNDKEKKLKNLSFFPGVQFRFYFPLTNIYRDKKDFVSSNHRTLQKTYKLLDYVSVNDHIKTPINESDAESISQLQSLLDSIERLKFKYEKQRGGILLDLAEFSNIAAKNVKHLIITSAVFAQTENLAFILVNIDKPSILELDADYSSDHYLNDKPCLLAYDNLFSALVIGSDSDSFNDFSASYKEKKPGVEKIFESRCRHFCRQDNDVLKLCYDKADVLRFFVSRLSCSIQTKILDPSFDVYFPSQKVLIPNKYYCDGFFELINLHDSRSLSAEIRTWIRANLQIHKPDCILTIGESAEILIDDIYSEFTSKNITLNAKHFHVDPSNIHYEAFRINQEIKSKDFIVIVTDVIGSSRLLTDVINQIKRENSINIFAIVNATPPPNTLFMRSIQFPIECIVEKHIEYFTSMPKNWDYSEIKIYDYKSNRLLGNNSLPQGPIWEILEKKAVRHKDETLEITVNPFLEDLANVKYSWFYGHFDSRNKHLLYLFNIRSIILYFSKSISEVVTSYIKGLEQKFLESDTHHQGIDAFSYLLYPSFNPGLDKVAEAIAKNFSELLLIPVDVHDIETGLSDKYDFSDLAVILIDDAFITGSTVEKMIDVVSERGAKQIFSFSLIKRGNSYQGRKFEKVRQYGDSTVHSRYLIDAEIPIFEKSTCPLCKKIEGYTRILRQVGDDDHFDEFRHFVERLKKQYGIRMVNAVFSERSQILEESEHHSDNARVDETVAEVEKPYFSRINLRWKLQVALTSVSMRKHISEIFSRLPSYSKAAILLITILSEEKYYFIDSQRNFESIFYDKQRLSLIGACKWFLGNTKDLNAVQFISVLDLIVALEESYFIEHISEMLLVSNQDDPFFYSVIVAIFLSAGSQQNPLRMSRILGNVSNEMENAPRKKFLKYLSKYYERRHAEIKAGKDTTFKLYNESMVLLHNLSHNLSSIDHYFDPEYYDRNMFLQNYNIFRQEIDEFRSVIDAFLDSVLSNNLLERVSNVIGKVEVLLDQIEEHVSLGHYSQSTNEYRTLFNRVRALLCDRENEQGFPNVLESMKVDIKEICFEIFQQERQKFEEKGIEFDFFLPDDVESVFGEDRYVFLIFKNLLENIHKHSQGKKSIVLGLEDEIEAKLTIMFIDDGVTSSDIVWREGLLSVQDSVHACGGSFSTSRIAVYQNAEIIREKFPEILEGTVAEVTFSYIKIKQRH